MSWERKKEVDLWKQWPLKFTGTETNARAKIWSKGERQKPDGKCKSESESEKCTVYSQQDASEMTVSAPYSPF